MHRCVKLSLHEPWWRGNFTHRCVKLSLHSGSSWSNCLLICSILWDAAVCQELLKQGHPRPWFITFLNVRLILGSTTEGSAGTPWVHSSWKRPSIVTIFPFILFIEKFRSSFFTKMLKSLAAPRLKLTMSLGSWISPEEIHRQNACLMNYCRHGTNLHCTSQSPEDALLCLLFVFLKQLSAGWTAPLEKVCLSVYNYTYTCRL